MPSKAAAKLQENLSKLQDENSLLFTFAFPQAPLLQKCFTGDTQSADMQTHGACAAILRFI